MTVGTTSEKRDLTFEEKERPQRKICYKNSHSTPSCTGDGNRKIIAVAGLWSENAQKRISEVIMECDCRTAFALTPLIKVDPHPLSIDLQPHTTIDIIPSEERNYINPVMCARYGRG